MPTASRRGELADLYQQGRYAEALPIAQETVAAAERERGPQDPELASNLNYLGLLYYASGDLGRAEPCLSRALAIREKVYGQQHLQVATSLNNLALVYEAMGEYLRAEPLYKRALAVRESLLKPEHPDVAASLNNLASLYYQLGDYGLALPLYQRAVEAGEKSLGPNHPDVATSLSNLAGLYTAAGQQAQAEALYRRALDIRQKALGADHPDVAASLNNLAFFLQDKGDLAQAEPLYRQALAITEKALGPDHPDVAATLSNLALVLAAKGEDRQAEALVTRALGIQQKALGEHHPDVAASYDVLAGLYASRGEYRRAHEQFKKMEEIDRKLIDQVMGFTSEEKKAAFLATKQSALEASLSLVAQYLIQDPAAGQDAFVSWVGRKGLILEAQRRFQEALIRTDDPAVRKAFEDLSAVRAQQSRLTFSGPGPDGPEAYRKNLSDLESQKNRLEEVLATSSQAYAAKKKMERADASTIARKLPAGSALVELARINYYDFKAVGTQSRWRPAHYLAFVVPAGQGGRIALKDLGPAAAIDQAVTDLKKAITSGDQSISAVSAASRRLYQLAFAPLRPEFGSARLIFVSPDGNLNLVPYEIFQTPEGRFLIEEYAFHYLSAGRDILGLESGSSAKGKPLLVGDPDFNLSGSEKKQTLTRLGISDTSPETTARAADMRGLKFSRLPGTREEIQAIQTLFGSGQEVFLGADAVEEVLKTARSPRIVHLATHGFFLSDSEMSTMVHKGQPGPKAKYINPLLRSGLVLAGANQALSGPAGNNDGILTAEKVLGLNLRGSDLVVLSACETGVGEIKNGEGVYGLRRAFSQAGANHIVMSLWPVPDLETKELMVEFYRNYLVQGLKPAQALRQAALKQIDLVKSRHSQAHPLFWGAFIFLGTP